MTNQNQNLNDAIKALQSYLHDPNGMKNQQNLNDAIKALQSYLRNPPESPSQP